jgi:hypothetical protein
MVQKRRGRPPSDKRKERDPIIACRIPASLLKSFTNLAKRRGVAHSARSVSRELRRAIEFWVYRHAITRSRNTRLGIAIAVLADRIEEITEKSWIDDPLTRQLVREHVQELVSDQLAPLSKPVAIPADVKEEAALILAVLKDAIGPRKFAGIVIVDDPGLAIIAQDLGGAHVETRPDLVARREQEPKAWADAERADTRAAWMNYIQKFGYFRPRRAAKARERIAALEKQKGRK